MPWIRRGYAVDTPWIGLGAARRVHKMHKMHKIPCAMRRAQPRTLCHDYGRGAQDTQNAQENGPTGGLDSGGAGWVFGFSLGL